MGKRALQSSLISKPARLAAILLLLAATAFSQVVIRKNPFVYKSAENYPTGVFDNYTVRDVAHNRQIPILVRYPIGPAGPLPMILWSHGGGADVNGKNGSVDWGLTLAQAGYIVIHMSHVPRTQAERLSLCTEFGVPDLQTCGGYFGALEVDRPRDANAVLADLDGIENSIPGGAGRIDRTRIGVAGHSFGSYTAMTVAGGRVELTPVFNDVSFANPLPKVFMALSPQGPGRFGWKDDSWREVFRPVLTATGLGDTTQGEDAPSRLVPFEMMPPIDKFRLFINHADSSHNTFNLNNPQRPDFEQWVASFGLAFLDANLKNDQAARIFLTNSRLSLYGSRSVVQISRK